MCCACRGGAPQASHEQPRARRATCQRGQEVITQKMFSLAALSRVDAVAAGRCSRTRPPSPRVPSRSPTSQSSSSTCRTEGSDCRLHRALPAAPAKHVSHRGGERLRAGRDACRRPSSTTTRGAPRARSTSRTQTEVLTTGALGTTLSHARAWQHVVEASAPVALVAEDDLAFTPPTLSARSSAAAPPPATASARRLAARSGRRATPARRRTRRLSSCRAARRLAEAGRGPYAAQRHARRLPRRPPERPHLPARTPPPAPA